MAKLHATVACNLDTDLLQATFPLFEEERVDAIEWSFDALFDMATLPDWFNQLLQAYSEAGRLIGHGIYFSLFSGRWTAEQQAWLSTLKRISSQTPFDHVSEHFGFMTGTDFHNGAPLPIPFNKTTLQIGRDRLFRIQDAATCPVGLENLAFAFSADEVNHQGEFLDALLHPVNGFIILDLHNVYCQSENFHVDPYTLISYYPLDRVREIHISGGSWQDSSVEPRRKIRRDTHDDAVPAEVFDLLHYALDRCADCKFVVLEQFGIALKSVESRARFAADFLKMEEIIAAKNVMRSEGPLNSFLPTAPFASGGFIEDADLAYQQQQLSDILERPGTISDALASLAASNLANSDWNIRNWNPQMLEAAMQIAQKWKDGFK